MAGKFKLRAKQDISLIALAVQILARLSPSDANSF